ncbi:hypothetical protein M885DRAFT_520991 [Pelagophyceae sp. CCMP2097]|nr:hypothetical protein M885DRAFT_520991 [Pelagophyceae sp. CCMP2097]|mmetsp:Transcript_28739/g.98981  ORF Transcript_28739/g.98981 Transcript_28739/m.98981 type:complete len:155 (-) Transcript_28739:83-547(-)
MLRAVLRCALAVATTNALVSHSALGALQRCGVAAPRFDATAPTPAEASLVGKELRVNAVQLTRSGELRHALLKCYQEAGDPYGVPADYALTHGDRVKCTAYADFAGQTWVQHEVVESLQGCIQSGRAPQTEPYLAWSPRDLVGHRWLIDWPIDN